MISPRTPPATDLSRARLRKLTAWIRDELDPLIAREGPDTLRPDDVLALREAFVALSQASGLTALDLRATGIHRAIQDIAGMATRWPGRLCDDCDKIISLWTAKFGPFSELRPFLYGRGGRLEGIANAHEYSREALLKRWSGACPERIHPKRAHKLGDLGFCAGDWWINTLFAHHAGIIGIEAIEGGITFDKHGAYALVLKDTGEVEAHLENHFTYRVSQSDKGKFRLTAATPRSRDPIRVLRSHDINSVWGPRAGVRYEGLYRVDGWSIHTAKTSDATSHLWKEGDILFEIRFNRVDEVPMSEVVKRPTATEVDDYSEYKRLRKIHRDRKRKMHNTVAHSPRTDAEFTKVAPPVLAQQASALDITRTGFQTSQGIAHKSTFKRLHFDQSQRQALEEPPIVSRRTGSDMDHFPLTLSKGSTLAERVSSPEQSPANQGHGSLFRVQNQDASSKPSSGCIATELERNIREVAPWTDADIALLLPTPKNMPPVTDAAAVSQNMSQNSLLPHDGPQLHTRHGGKNRVMDINMPSILTRTPSKFKDSRKSVFVKTKSPMAKLLDGAPAGENKEEREREDSFGPILYEPDSPHVGDEDQDVDQDDETEVELKRQGKRDPLARRKAISWNRDHNNEDEESNGGRSVMFPCFPQIPMMVPEPIHGRHIEVEFPAPIVLDTKDDVFSGPAFSPLGRISTSLPISLKRLISQSKFKMATKDMHLKAGAEKMVQEGDGDGRITFRNPFGGEGSEGNAERARNRGSSSGDVAPDVMK